MYPQLEAYKNGLRSPLHIPNTFGFKQNLDDIFHELYLLRSAGIDVSLASFLPIWCENKVKSPDKSAAAEFERKLQEHQINLNALELGEFTSGGVNLPSKDELHLQEILFADIGIECLENARVTDLISVEYGLTGIFTEQIRAALIKGIRTAPITSRIVASTSNMTNSPTAIFPYVDITQSTPEAIGEAVNYPMAIAVFSQRLIDMKKYGMALRITDEAVRYSSVDLITQIMEQQGKKVGMVGDSRALYIIIHGDQVDGSMAPAVIGVSDTTKGFQFSDFIHCRVRMGICGVFPDTIIAGVADTEAILAMDEFSAPVYAGNDRTMVQISFTNNRTFEQVQVLTKSNMPANTIIVLDSNLALHQINGKPFNIEKERRILTDSTIAKFSQEMAFANLNREATAVVMTNQTRTGNYTFDHYDHMDPFDDITLE
jgi:hypothetical protein